MDGPLATLLGLLKEASTLVSRSVAPPPPFKPPTDTPAATAAGGAKGGNKQKGEQPDKKGASKSRCVAADSAIKQAVQGLAEDYACPISSQLMVQPVLAEDGFLYECKAIEKWLRTKATSPKTLRPMGKRLVDDLVAKQTIAKLLEAGAVADDEAVAWHLEKGALHMEDSPAGSGAMLAAEHFRAAADLGSSEGALRLVGAELQRLVGTFADKSGIQLGASSGAPPAGQRRLMTAWEDLPVGSLIWVIDDARELERLCERPAPGVDDAVGFNVEMIALCGKTYRVCGVYASQLSFGVPGL